MQVLLTVDVEAHRVLDEISGTEHDSLAFILSALHAHRMTGTFFVDMCGADTWGEAVIRRACDRIQAGGHDVQLHVHPHHASRDGTRWHLSQYSPDEQAVILRQAIDRYRAYLGRSPYAFRAGGFGLDDASIDLIREAGVVVDSSYLWGWKGCNITPVSKGRPSRYRGVTEFPLTPIISLGTLRWPIRIGALDFNWQPLFVLQDALTKLRASGAPIAVVLLHSSSMYVRVGERRLLYRRAHERKLHKLLAFLHAQEFRVATVTDAATRGLAEPPPPSDDTVYVAHGLAVQHAILLFQSFIGFGISAKLRAFALGHVGAVLVVIGVLAWLSQR